MKKHKEMGVHEPGGFCWGEADMGHGKVSFLLAKVQWWAQSYYYYFLNVANAHNFTTLVISNVQFSRVKYIHPTGQLIFRTFSSCKTKTLRFNNSLFPVNHHSTVCLYEFAYSRELLWVESHSFCHFVTGYFT